MDQPPPEERVKLILQVQNTGYVLASTAGDRIEVPKTGDRYDTVELRNKLQERHRLEPNRRDLIVAPEDGVEYMFVVEAMDVVVGEGYPDMTLSDGAGLVTPASAPGATGRSATLRRDRRRRVPSTARWVRTAASRWSRRRSRTTRRSRTPSAEP